MHARNCSIQLQLGMTRLVFTINYNLNKLRFSEGIVKHLLSADVVSSRYQVDCGVNSVRNTFQYAFPASSQVFARLLTSYLKENIFSKYLVY